MVAVGADGRQVPDRDLGVVIGYQQFQVLADAFEDRPGVDLVERLGLGMDARVLQQRVDHPLHPLCAVDCEFHILLGLVPWLTIAGTYSFGEGSPPDFVIAIYVSLFVLFNLFAINMLLQYRGVWKWKEYLFGEYVYIVLSLIAKSLLAWQVYFGALNSPV